MLRFTQHDSSLVTEREMLRFASLSMIVYGDYAHHDPIHSHRVYSLQAVERAPQPPGSDDGKSGDDDGNPYMTVLASPSLRFSHLHHCLHWQGERLPG